MSDTKKCSKCGEVKGLGEFVKERSRCLECNRRMHKEWRDRNAEHVRAAGRANMAKQYAANPDKFRKRSLDWHFANQPRAKARQAKTNKRISVERAQRRSEKNASTAYSAHVKAWKEQCRKERANRLNAAYRESINDSYVLTTLGMCNGEATPELIALKREQLAIKRMARELKKAATKPTGENE